MHGIDHLLCASACLRALQRWSPQFAADSLVNAAGRTGLHFAAEASDIDACILLLRHGAPADVPQEGDGLTPLMYAVRACASTDVIKLLLSAGADPCGRDWRAGTPLHYAVGLGEVGMPLMEQLLHVHADPDVVDERGVSPLAFAAICGQAKLVERLLDCGARGVGCRKLLPFIQPSPHKDLLQLISPPLVVVGASQLESQVRVRLKAAAYKEGGRKWAELIRQQDKDRSGFIEFEEFRDMCRVILKLPSKDHDDDELLQVFLTVDEDGSGEVSIEELIAFVEDAF